MPLIVITSDAETYDIATGLLVMDIAWFLNPIARNR